MKFAHLFPANTKTFCVPEVAGMRRMIADA
jgi:hypothetical protein